ncbi:MAG: asparaginase [Rhodopseudomonas palustris]|uniref:Asparaginase n=1 Tax=Rhodopseudomonas palustris TaxID=1076 RepID=A0A933S2U9_RHOPL|nr:asparaginase [Rhodopseudomonas palustris]
MTGAARGGVSPTLGAADLLQDLPHLSAVADVESLTLMRKPGASLSFDDLGMLAALLVERLADTDLNGAVVVQGTDTIEETAFALDILVQSGKPVVVTGAMRPPQAAGCDGPANLLSSVIVAADAASRSRGALVVLNDEIHAARFVRKGHTTLPSSFRSSHGPVGFVVEGQARFAFPASTAPGPRRESKGRFAPVALLSIALGDDGRMIGAHREAGYKGAVVEGLGAGHVPANLAPLLGDLASSIPVVLTSRVQLGPTLTQTYSFAGSEMDLLERGLISGGSLGSAKARILLALLLGAEATSDEIRSAFDASAHS